MTKIIQRNDTSKNWATANPVLAIGEVGWESDTKKFKLGDGVTAWNSLAYVMADEFTVYREKYGAPSDSTPVINNGNSITIKAGVSIETPNGTLNNTTDMTYTYDFATDRVLFVTENDYYHAFAVYYGGREPSPVGEQIFWFNNNVWTMIAGDGTKTTFSTQKITPIAKIYQTNSAVENIDYSSFAKISGESPAPSNMVTTDTEQNITGTKTFINDMFLPCIIVQNSVGDSAVKISAGSINVGMLTLNTVTYLTADSTGVILGNTSLQQVILRGEKVQCYDPAGNKDILHTGNAFKQVKLTQAEYDALTTKEESTMYIIVG